MKLLKYQFKFDGGTFGSRFNDNKYFEGIEATMKELGAPVIGNDTDSITKAVYDRLHNLEKHDIDTDSDVVF